MVIFKNGKVIGVDKDFLDQLNERLNTLSYLLNIIELQIADLKRETVQLKGNYYRVTKIPLVTLEEVEVFQLEPVEEIKNTPTLKLLQKEKKGKVVPIVKESRPQFAVKKGDEVIPPVSSKPVEVDGIKAGLVEEKKQEKGIPSPEIPEISENEPKTIVKDIIPTGELTEPTLKEITEELGAENLLSNAKDGISEEELEETLNLSELTEKAVTSPISPKGTSPSSPEKREAISDDKKGTGELDLSDLDSLIGTVENGKGSEDKKGEVKTAIPELPESEDLPNLELPVAESGEKEGKVELSPAEPIGAKREMDLEEPAETSPLNLEELEFPEPAMGEEPSVKELPTSTTKTSSQKDSTPISSVPEEEFENLDDLLGDLELEKSPSSTATSSPTEKPEKKEEAGGDELEELDQLLEGIEPKSSSKGEIESLKEEKRTQEVDLGLEELESAVPSGDEFKKDADQLETGLEDLEDLDITIGKKEEPKTQLSTQSAEDELDLGDLELGEPEILGEPEKEKKKEKDSGKSPEEELNSQLEDLVFEEEKSAKVEKVEPTVADEGEKGKEETDTTTTSKTEDKTGIDKGEKVKEASKTEPEIIQSDTEPAKPKGPIILQFDDDFEEVRQLLHEAPETAKQKIFEELTKASEELGIPPDLGEELFKELLNQIKMERKNFEQILKNRDYEDLHKTAHKLKGAALNLRLSQLALILKMIDEYSKRREPIDVIADLVHNFYSFMDKLDGIESSMGGATNSQSTVEPISSQKEESGQKSPTTPPKEEKKVHLKPKITRLVLKTIRKYLEKGDERAFQKDKKHIEKLLKTELNSLDDLKKFIGD